MKRRLIGGWVVGWTGSDHELLEGGCVVFDGDQVAFVGFPDDPACPSADEDVDLPGRLISPGSINLHCIANIDLQPLRIDVAAVGFPKSRAWFDGTDQVFSDAQFETSARFAVATLLRNGSTTFANVTTMASKRYDDPRSSRSRWRARLRSWARAGTWPTTSRTTAATTTPTARTTWCSTPPRGRAGLARAVALVERIRRDFDDRVQGFLFPYTTETCSDDLLRAARDAAADLGVTLRSHFAQYREEARGLLEREGISPVERMDRLGILGPQTTLTHAIFLRGHPEVGHGDHGRRPGAPRRQRHERGPLPGRLLAPWRGAALLRPLPPRRHQPGARHRHDAPADILGEMRMAATLAKVVDEDPLAPAAPRRVPRGHGRGAVPSGATTSGAWHPATKADVSVFDLRSLQLGVIDCPIKALVHYASGADAEHVFVDGAWVVRDRDVVGDRRRRDPGRGAGRVGRLQGRPGRPRPARRSADGDVPDRVPGPAPMSPPPPLDLAVLGGTVVAGDGRRALDIGSGRPGGRGRRAGHAAARARHRRRPRPARAAGHRRHPLPLPHPRPSGARGLRLRNGRGRRRRRHHHPRDADQHTGLRHARGARRPDGARRGAGARRRRLLRGARRPRPHRGSHEMVAAGAVAFKAMMHAAPPGREASFAGLGDADDRDLYRALEAVAATGKVLAVHAEHQSLIDLFEAREQADERGDPGATRCATRARGRSWPRPPRSRGSAR
jgi:cytosine/adenosine deaminase-related metal-dependent hydrolase